jgi:hypothetical protein
VKKKEQAELLRTQCLELVRTRQTLEDTKRRCAEEEAALSAEIEANAKLMYTLTDDAQMAAAQTSKERTEGDFKTRSLMTKVGRMQQKKTEAERRRFKLVKQMEQEGIELEDGDTAESESPTRRNSISASAFPLSSTQDSLSMTQLPGTPVAAADGDQPPAAAEAEEKEETEHLTVQQIHKLREQFAIDVEESIVDVAGIKQWNAAQQQALRLARKTRKWIPGPPLPNDFLPAEEKAKLRAAAEAAEKQRKAEQLKAILSGPAAAADAADRPLPKKKSKKKKK